MTLKAFTLPAEAPWAPATIIVADRCVECREAEPELVWNRAYAVCRACADRWQAEINRKRWESDDDDKD